MFRRAYNIAHLKDSEVDRGIFGGTEAPRGIGDKVCRVSLKRTFGIAKAAGYSRGVSRGIRGTGYGV